MIDLFQVLRAVAQQVPDKTKVVLSFEEAALLTKETHSHQKYLDIKYIGDKEYPSFGNLCIVAEPMSRIKEY